MSFTPAYQQRFGGIVRLYGTRAAEALFHAHILIIGIGGVGSWAAEALVRSGVGTISLMDLDDICISNTNRQIHTTQDTIGSAKTDIMAQRLRAINPEIKLHCIEDFLDNENMSSLIVKNQYSLVIDAIDGTMTKTALIAYCKRQKIPIITTGSAGGKQDPSKITYGDLSKTVNDPLLSKVRNNLRRLHNFSRTRNHVFSVEAIYSTEQMTYPDDQGETCQHRGFLSGEDKLDCSGGYGASTAVTASFGLLASARAIEKIKRKAHKGNTQVSTETPHNQ